jgi:hypothetical protein
MMAMVAVSMQAAVPLARSSGGSVGIAMVERSPGRVLADPEGPHAAIETARPMAVRPRRTRRAAPVAVGVV